MPYIASEQRYDDMNYARSGKSGIKLPQIALGLWQNFGGNRTLDIQEEMILRAFDLGITHFDLANNYGPPPGSAEENFGVIYHKHLRPYRDELLISSKAGYHMWSGPYGEWGSRKNLIASLDQSLRRMGLDYVDIFYHHRPDPETPLEETMTALDHIVRQGKALYVGLSNYNAEQTREAVTILRRLGTSCLVHQPNYSMLNRWIEDGLQDVLQEQGVASIAFCPLGRGQLTNKYVDKIKAERANPTGNLKTESYTDERIAKFEALQAVAERREQTISQLALNWVLRGNRVTSALIGASRVSQIEENVAALKAPELTAEELNDIEAALVGIGNYPW
ncbi:aldo/keto reductase [Paenibacillus silvae]|uniref:aldo/keto reductase n=1 Tax=Paenibacillus silvae TaxID=1325358 RepID=UPI002003A983|nr:aldo/keto reductase [Paenibacillus silvae]MCK6073679.1 aldo/keto reductase [Paenibacillus silvae]MCK6148844.1 aldo/keto reductase [Paenibacillus silvae]MCK6267145.1 aldo/keto reductase [Paenibacillus silvae]